MKITSKIAIIGLFSVFFFACAGDAAANNNGTAPTIEFSETEYSFPINDSIGLIAPAITGDAITDCYTVPDLPTGLIIRQDDCRIGGTPTTEQEATPYQVTVVNSVGYASAQITITLTPPKPSLEYSDPFYTFTQNQAGSWAPTLVENQISCYIDPALPSGLSIDYTCTISGTPTLLQDLTTYTVKAVNYYGTTERPVYIKVVSP